MPEERDLLAQVAARLGVLVRRHERIVQVVQEAADAAQRHQQGPATRLGGMRGEDRVHVQAAEHLHHAITAMVGREPRHRLADGVLHHAGPGLACLCPQRADALPLLGDVDQLEVGGERLAHGGQLREWQRGDLRGEAFALRVRLRDELRVTPEGDGPAPDPLHGGEQLRPALLRDDLAQQRTQEADLAAERVPRASKPRAGGFRGHSGKPRLRGEGGAGDAGGSVGAGWSGRHV